MRPSIRSSIASSVLAASFAVVAPARADGDKVAAEALFAEGRRLMADGLYEEACPKLAESQRLDPGGGTLLNLALCHEKQGKSATAWSEYKEALAVARRDGREDRIAFAQEHIAGLEPVLSRLVVEVPQPVEGLVVELDGAALGRASWGIAMPVDPGAHEIEARAEGYEPWSGEATVEGEAAREMVTVPALVRRPEAPKSEEPPSAPRPVPPAVVPDPEPNVQRIVGYSIGGLGLLSAVVGAGFGVSALSKDSDADAVCEQDTCPPTPAGDAALAQAEGARQDATFANAFVGVGAGLVAVGLVVVLTASDEPSPEAGERASLELHPNLDPQNLGAALHLTW